VAHVHCEPRERKGTAAAPPIRVDPAQQTLRAMDAGAQSGSQPPNPDATGRRIARSSRGAPLAGRPCRGSGAHRCARPRRLRLQGSHNREPPDRGRTATRTSPGASTAMLGTIGQALQPSARMRRQPSPKQAPTSAMLARHPRGCHTERLPMLSAEYGRRPRASVPTTPSTREPRPVDAVRASEPRYGTWCRG